MQRSAVRLPAKVGDEFDVYVNGVLQREDIDYTRADGWLLFTRWLQRDRISGMRWFLGAWGIGTYRQDDTIDVRYEVDGVMRVAHALSIEAVDDGTLTSLGEARL